MTLESILKPVISLDKQIQKQYTKVGKKIPEKDLYKVTSWLYFSGGLLSVFGAVGYELNYNLPKLYGIFFGASTSHDFSYNLSGLSGEFKDNKISSGSMSLNKIKELYISLNRTTRLPYFLAGLYFLGKSTYEISDLLINNQQSKDISNDLLLGIGFLEVASSMYLKDQDPKLLEKKPSKVKAFLKSLYERIAPQPIPQPQFIPISQSYKSIEDYL